MRSFIVALTTLAVAVSAAPATCVASAAASTSTSSFSLPDYSAMTPPVSNEVYDIAPAFQDAYGFNSTMVSLMLPK